MKDTIPDLELSERIIEDIKVRTCFITTRERSVKLTDENELSPPPAVKYPGVKNFEIPGFVREKAYEVLWDRDNDNLSVPTMILDAIIKVSFLILKKLIFFKTKIFFLVSSRYETSIGGKYSSSWRYNNGHWIRESSQK